MQRAMNVRDVLGDRIGRMPRDKENCITWIIGAQIKANKAVGGEQLTPSMFGVPKDLAHLAECVASTYLLRCSPTGLPATCWP